MSKSGVIIVKEYDFMKDLRIPREFEGEIKVFDALVNAEPKDIDNIVKLITIFFPEGALTKQVYFFILHAVQIRPRLAEVYAEIWKRVYQTTHCQINYQRYRNCRVGFFFLYLYQRNLIEKSSITGYFGDDYDSKKFLALHEYIPEINKEYYEDYIDKLPDLYRNKKQKLHKFFKEDVYPGSLMSAIKFDNLPEFKRLTKDKGPVEEIWIERYEFDISPWDLEGDMFNVISYSAYWGSINIFKYCIEKAEIIGNYVVEAAVAGGNPEIIELALQQPGLSLKTSLDYAIYYHRNEIIDRCLKEGYGDTSSLCLAARSMSIPMALYYLNKGVSPNVTWGNHKEFPLYLAAKTGHISMLRLLLQKGADPNQRLFDGRSVMHRCAKFGHLEMIDVLKKAGGDINAQTTRYKETPLHFAAEVKNEMTIGFLIKLGADWKITNSDGLTFYEILQEPECLPSQMVIVPAV